LTRGKGVKTTNWEALEGLTLEYILDYNDVDTSGECWEARRRMTKRGYCWVSHKGQVVRSSRAVIFVTTGVAPIGLEASHTCDNPPCLRPDHLVARTHAANMKEMSDRRRRHGKGTGLSSGAYTHPEARARGDKNGARLHPERLARGDVSGPHHHPEKMARGEMNGMHHLNPARVMRTCECGMVSTAGGMGNHVKHSGHTAIPSASAQQEGST